MSNYSIQNILVPIDLSETSLNAVDTAVALAKKHKAALHLLHVDEAQPQFSYGDIYSSSTLNADVLSAICSSIKHQHGLAPNIIEAEGNVVNSIVATSFNLPADLIVMGTHGASGFRDGFIGTNSYQTIKYALCPVLTVPPGRKRTAFKKVLFPVRPISGALANYSAINHFFTAKTTLDVVGFSFKGEGATGVLDKLIDEAMTVGRWTDVTTKSFWGALSQISETVLQHAHHSKADLVILTSLLDAVDKPTYIGPHAQKIIHSAKLPILSIKKASVSSFAHILQTATC